MSELGAEGGQERTKGLKESQEIQLPPQVRADSVPGDAAEATAKLGGPLCQGF